MTEKVVRYRTKKSVCRICICRKKVKTETYMTEKKQTTRQ